MTLLDPIPPGQSVSADDMVWSIVLYLSNIGWNQHTQVENTSNIPFALAIT